VSVDWARQAGGALTLAVSIPVNVRARVVLPASAAGATKASGEGQPKLESDEAGRVVYAVGSGRSQFSVSH
jgi:hypothetical protein